MRRSPARVCHVGDRATMCGRRAGSALALDVEVEHVPLDVVVICDRDPLRCRSTGPTLVVDALEVSLDVVSRGLLDVVAHGSPS
jgi:hypothetical protein